jgi:hypothetical protein
MNELYRLLDLDIHPIVGTSLEGGKRITKLHKENINPVLVEYLLSKGLFITHSEIFYSHPGFNGLIHIDGVKPDDETNWPDRCKLNFSIGSKDATITWYDMVGQKRFKSAPTMISTNFLKFEPEDCIEITTAKLPNWHLFQAGVPHAVNNRTSYPRWCISFVLSDREDSFWTSFDSVASRLR